MMGRVSVRPGASEPNEWGFVPDGERESAVRHAAGRSLLSDLQKLTTAVGLTNEEALAAATVNFDRAYGLHSVGRVQPGYYANLVVLRKKPIRSLSYLDTEMDRVIVKGKVITY